MEFLEGSRGIYRPIRVLFDTPIYHRALQICWNISSYKSQIALLMELLKLQQENQIPPQVTAEDMLNFILEKSKSTLRERLWEFELEGFDEDEAKPLLKLLWAVNVSNKMRDVEFEAKMLLRSPEAVPLNFQHPKILNKAQDYAKILTEQHQETLSSKLCAEEVVIEVVPRVLQGFWVLPQKSLLNMPSQLLSKMTVGVTKAVLDRVSSALTTLRHQATFSRSIRDDMVLSIQTTIRETHPHDILVSRMKSFAPVLLTEIVDVAVRNICEMFQPQRPKVQAQLTPTCITLVQEAVTVEQTAPNAAASSLPDEPVSIGVPGKPSLDENTEQTKEPQFAEVLASLTPSAELSSINKVQAREDVREMLSQDADPEATKKTDSAVIKAPPTPPAEHLPQVHPREDANEEPGLDKDLEPNREPHSVAVPAPVTLPDEPVSIEVPGKPSLDENTEQTKEPQFAEVLASLTPSAELSSINKVQTREDVREMLSQDADPEATKKTDSAVIKAPPTPPAEHLPQVHPREDANEEPGLDRDLEPNREPHSVAVPAPVTLPDEPVSIEVPGKPSLDENTEQTKEPQFAEVLASLTPSAELSSINKVQTREDVREMFNQDADPEATKKTDSAVIKAPPTLPAEHLSQVHPREVANEEPNLDKDLKPNREPHSVAVPAPVTLPDEPVSIEVPGKPSLDENTEQTKEPQFAEVLAFLTPSAELSSINKVQAREDVREMLSQDADPEATKKSDSAEIKAPPTLPAEHLPQVHPREDANEEPHSALVQASLRPDEPLSVEVPASAVVIVVDTEVTMTKVNRALRFLRRLFKPLCCCFPHKDND